MNEAPSSQAQRRPDVFIDATPEDRERLAALIDGLRARSLRVEHFYDGLIAGGRRAEAASDLYRFAYIVLVPMTSLGRSLKRDRRPELDRIQQDLASASASVFALRFADSDAAPEVPPAGILDVRTPAELDAAIRTIASHVDWQSSSAGSSSNPVHSSGGKTSNPAPRARPDPGVLRLQLGNETGTEDWTVTPALHAVLHSGARFWPRPLKAPERFTLSFKTLLLSLFNTADRWSIWSRETGARTGFRAERVFEEQGLTRDEIAERAQPPLSDAERSAPVSATTSAAAILRSAREHARRTDSVLDVQHVLAAVIHDPAGHEAELARWGFQPAAWSAGLADEVAARVPRDAGYFRKLHQDRFEAAPNEHAPTEQVQSTAPTVSGERPVDPWAASFWSQARPELKEALAVACALATEDDRTVPLTPRHVLGGLITRLNDSPLTQAWLRIVPPNLDELERPWQRVVATLGFPTLKAVLAPPDALPELDGAARSVLERAQQGKAVGDVTEIDVFLALWHPPEGGAAPIDPILVARNIDPDSALETLCTDPGLASHAAALRALLDRRRAAVAWSRPEVHTDRVDGAIPFARDMLDVGPAARRFAKLLADKHVTPPIAVGLFGNWGSGKTFFMGLMRSHVKELMETQSTRYARRVVQIEFNAWHYHDTNLWASLAIHIFEELAKALSATSESSIEVTRRQLHERMSSSKAHRKEAQQQRDQALERRTAAAQQLEAKRRERDEKVRSSLAQRLEIAWGAVQNGKSFQTLREQSQALAAQFGIVELGRSVESVQAVRADIEKTRAHAFGLFTAIGRRFKDTRSGVATVTFLLSAVLLALALGWGTERVFEELRMLAPRYSGTVMEIATMLSVVAAWCGRRVRQLQSGLDAIGKIEADLAAEEKRVTSTEHSSLLDLEQQIVKLDKEILDADGKVAAADQEIAQAQAEIDRINRGGLVYDFLQQRRTSATYVSQLGLVSTIRQDLQDLDALLEDFAKNAKDDAPAIDRILLYIDDLDRCHPDKVLEVLQAVHLLLTFDLFNVVVGVDARWLERSLRRQYEQKLGGRGLAADGFSPQDYLEKIFQIPFALGGMDSRGFKKFVGDMVETRSEWTQRRQKEERDARERAEKEAHSAHDAAAQREPTNVGRATPSDAPADAPATSVKEDPVGDGSRTRATPADAPAGNPAATPPQREETPQYLEDHEATFIDALHPFIDRPRLAKRFVNIYKLLRVTADDEGTGATFSRPAVSEEYRAALILLAIHIGHQGLSMRLVPELLGAEADATWSSVLEALGDPKRAGARLSNDERREFALVRTKLARLGVPVPEGLAAYRHWAQRVLCYSFEPLRLTSPPTDSSNGSVRRMTLR